jgi:hypothetical protein
MTVAISPTINGNGQPRSQEVEPHWLLVYYLRADCRRGAAPGYVELAVSTAVERAR